MSKFLFLLGPHKSGTSLLRALLDGHPELDVVPVESHVFQFSGWPILYPYKRQRNTPFSFSEFKARALQSIEEYNRSDEDTADGNFKDRFDLIVFDAAFSESFDSLSERMILKYFNAIKLSLGCAPLETERIIVEKSIENAELAMGIQMLLPESKFIHIIRDPYSNLVSIRKFKTFKDRFPSLSEIVGCLETNYHFLELNSRLKKLLCFTV